MREFEFAQECRFVFRQDLTYGLSRYVQLRALHNQLRFASLRASLAQHRWCPTRALPCFAKRGKYHCAHHRCVQQGHGTICTNHHTSHILRVDPLMRRAGPSGGESHTRDNCFPWNGRYGPGYCKCTSRRRRKGCS